MSAISGYGILVLIEIKILHIIVDIQNNQAHLASSIKLKLNSDLDYSGCHTGLETNGSQLVTD